MPVQPSVFTMIDADWAMRARWREAARQLDVWRGSCPPLGDLGRLEKLPAWLLAQHPRVVDKVLVVLVEDGGPLARRAVLQILQPGVRSIAAEIVRLGIGPDEAAAVVLVAAAHFIAHPPRCVAMCKALLLNVRRDSWRAAHELASTYANEQPAQPDSMAELAEPVHTDSPSGELVAVLRQAVDQKIVSLEDASLVAATRMGRTSVDEVAAERCCSVWSVYRARGRAEGSLRDAAGLLT
jgi:hypothetical protein